MHSRSPIKSHLFASSDQQEEEEVGIVVNRDVFKVNAGNYCGDRAGMINKIFGIENRILSQHDESTCSLVDDENVPSATTPRTPREQIITDDNSQLYGLTDSPQRYAHFYENSPTLTTPPPPQRTPAKVLSRRPLINPSKILDAPYIQPGYNQLLDWNIKGLSVALGTIVYFWNPDEKRVEERTIEVCDMESNITTLRMLPHSCGVLSIGYSETMSLVDTTRPDVVKLLLKMPSQVTCQSHSGGSIAVGSSEGSISIYDVRSASQFDLSNTTSSTSINYLTHSPDGSTLVIGSSDGDVSLYCMKQQKTLQSIKTGGPITGLSWCKHQHTTALAVSGGQQGNSIMLVNLLCGRIATKQLLSCPVTGIMWNGDELISIHGSDLELETPCLEVSPNSATMWKPASGELKHVSSLVGHHSPINHIAASPDLSHPQLVTAGLDERLRFWELDPPNLRTANTQISIESLLQIR